MIQGHGHSSAKIMLIADGASAEDMATGYALSGYNDNRILKSFCNDHGIDYASLWKTALIKDRINLSKPEANIPLITDQYRQILMNEIQSVAPNVLVPLSELAFNFVSGGINGIRKFRGSILPAPIPGRNVRVIPVLGPNPYLNQDYKLSFISRLDFGKVAKNADRTDPITEIGNCWIAKSASQLRTFLERIYNQIEKYPFLVFDIETWVGIPTCISMCFDGDESVTAPLLDVKIPIDDRVLMARMVAKVLSSDIPKVNQNIKFDWKHLEHFKFLVNRVAGDTLLAASCIYPEFPKKLGFLTSIYTDMPYFKDEAKQFDPTTHNRDKLYLYCAKDSLATHKIYSQQLEEMKELGVERPYKDLIRIMPIYKRAEERGIRIDDTRRKQLLGKYTSLFDMQVFKARLLCSKETLNPLSSDQCRVIVFGDLGYRKIRGVHLTPTGKISVDEDTLELLLWKGQSNYTNAAAILRTFINCRKLHKVIEYLETPLHPDKRMRSEFNLGGADTGRTTASDSGDQQMYFDKGKVKLEYLGRSFQTIAKHGFEVDFVILGRELRSMFVPSPGYEFVECDLSGAEARVDCVLTNDLEILPIFDDPAIGIHRLTGSWIYNCLPEEIKKNVLVDGVERYYTAKTVRHAAERNLGEEHLMIMIHQPIMEARRILNTIHDKQPNIRKVFHKEIYETLQREQRLTAPDGSRRDFFGKFDYKMVNQGISYLPQVIVTRYLKAAIGPTFEELPWAEMLSEAHDGILSEVPIGKSPEFYSIFKRNVEQPIDFRRCSLKRDYQLVIPCEGDYSRDNWQSMKGIE